MTSQQEDSSKIANLINILKQKLSADHDYEEIKDGLEAAFTHFTPSSLSIDSIDNSEALLQSNTEQILGTLVKTLEKSLNKILRPSISTILLNLSVESGLQQQIREQRQIYSNQNNPSKKPIFNIKGGQYESAREIMFASRLPQLKNKQNYFEKNNQITKLKLNVSGLNEDKSQATTGDSQKSFACDIEVIDTTRYNKENHQRIGAAFGAVSNSLQYFNPLVQAQQSVSNSIQGPNNYLIQLIHILGSLANASPLVQQEMISQIASYESKHSSMQNDNNSKSEDYITHSRVLDRLLFEKEQKDTNQSNDPELAQLYKNEESEDDIFSAPLPFQQQLYIFQSHASSLIDNIVKSISSSQTDQQQKDKVIKDVISSAVQEIIERVHSQSPQQILLPFRPLREIKERDNKSTDQNNSTQSDNKTQFDEKLITHLGSIVQDKFFHVLNLHDQHRTLDYNFNFEFSDDFPTNDKESTETDQQEPEKDKDKEFQESQPMESQIMEQQNYLNIHTSPHPTSSLIPPLAPPSDLQITPFNIFSHLKQTAPRNRSKDVVVPNVVQNLVNITEDIEESIDGAPYTEAVQDIIFAVRLKQMKDKSNDNQIEDKSQSQSNIQLQLQFEVMLRKALLNESDEKKSKNDFGSRDKPPPVPFQSGSNSYPPEPLKKHQEDQQNEELIKKKEEEQQKNSIIYDQRRINETADLIELTSGFIIRTLFTFEHPPSIHLPLHRLIAASAARSIITQNRNSFIFDDVFHKNHKILSSVNVAFVISQEPLILIATFMKLFSQLGLLRSINKNKKIDHKLTSGLSDQQNLNTYNTYTLTSITPPTFDNYNPYSNQYGPYSQSIFSHAQQYLSVPVTLKLLNVAALYTHPLFAPDLIEKDILLLQLAAGTVGWEKFLHFSSLLFNVDSFFEEEKKKLTLTPNTEQSQQSALNPYSEQRLREIEIIKYRKSLITVVHFVNLLASLVTDRSELIRASSEKELTESKQITINDKSATNEYLRSNIAQLLAEAQAEQEQRRWGFGKPWKYQQELEEQSKKEDIDNKNGNIIDSPVFIGGVGLTIEEIREKLPESIINNPQFEIALNSIAIKTTERGERYRLRIHGDGTKGTFNGWRYVNPFHPRAVLTPTGTSSLIGELQNVYIQLKRKNDKNAFNVLKDSESNKTQSLNDYFKLYEGSENEQYKDWNEEEEQKHEPIPGLTSPSLINLQFPPSDLGNSPRFFEILRTVVEANVIRHKRIINQIPAIQIAQLTPSLASQGTEDLLFGLLRILDVALTDEIKRDQDVNKDVSDSLLQELFGEGKAKLLQKDEKSNEIKQKIYLADNLFELYKHLRHWTPLTDSQGREGNEKYNYDPENALLIPLISHILKKIRHLANKSTNTTYINSLIRKSDNNRDSQINETHKCKICGKKIDDQSTGGIIAHVDLSNTLQSLNTAAIRSFVEEAKKDRKRKKQEGNIKEQQLKNEIKIKQLQDKTRKRDIINKLSQLKKESELLGEVDDDNESKDIIKIDKDNKTEGSKERSQENDIKNQKIKENTNTDIQNQNKIPRYDLSDFDQNNKVRQNANNAQLSNNPFDPNSNPPVPEQQTNEERQLEEAKKELDEQNKKIMQNLKQMMNVFGGGYTQKKRRRKNTGKNKQGHGGYSNDSDSDDYEDESSDSDISSSSGDSLDFYDVNEHEDSELENQLDQYQDEYAAFDDYSSDAEGTDSIVIDQDQGSSEAVNKKNKIINPKDYVKFETDEKDKNLNEQDKQRKKFVVNERQSVTVCVSRGAVRYIELDYEDNITQSSAQTDNQSGKIQPQEIQTQKEQSKEDSFQENKQTNKNILPKVVIDHIPIGSELEGNPIIFQHYTEQLEQLENRNKDDNKKNEQNVITDQNKDEMKEIEQQSIISQQILDFQEIDPILLQFNNNSFGKINFDKQIMGLTKVQVELEREREKERFYLGGTREQLEIWSQNRKDKILKLQNESIINQQGGMVKDDNKQLIDIGKEEGNIKPANLDQGQSYKYNTLKIPAYPSSEGSLRSGAYSIPVTIANALNEKENNNEQGLYSPLWWGNTG
ncbi:MAG: hypothetical protein EZS28_013175, partial [Streblomastix strix]